MQTIVKAAIQQNLKSVNEKLSDISTSIGGVKSAISAAMTRIADLEKRFDSMEDLIGLTVKRDKLSGLRRTLAPST